MEINQFFQRSIIIEKLEPMKVMIILILLFKLKEKKILKKEKIIF